MHQEQRDQTRALLRTKGVDRALFSDPANVTWLTGVPLPWRAGAYLYAGGPALVWYESGHFTLILMDGHSGEAAPFAEQQDCSLVTYQGYAYKEQPAGFHHLEQALQSVVTSADNGRVGVEKRSLPAALLDHLPGRATLVAIDEWLKPLRLTRTDEELAKMRRNFALIDAAQAVCDDLVVPGNLELDVWHGIQAAMQYAAGETLFLGNDCTVGRRSGGPALSVEILPGDSFIIDLSTIWRGYWSDSCVTYYATEPLT